jgi:hypothetical protein
MNYYCLTLDDDTLLSMNYYCLTLDDDTLVSMNYDCLTLYGGALVTISSKKTISKLTEQTFLSIPVSNSDPETGYPN